MNDFGCVFIIQWLIEMHIFVSNIVSPSFSLSLLSSLSLSSFLPLSLSNSPRSIAIQRDIVPMHSRTRTLVARSSLVGAFAVAVVCDQPGFDVEITIIQWQATHFRGNRPRDGIVVQVPAFNKKAIDPSMSHTQTTSREEQDHHVRILKKHETIGDERIKQSGGGARHTRSFPSGQ